MQVQLYPSLRHLESRKTRALCNKTRTDRCLFYTQPSPSSRPLLHRPPSSPLQPQENVHFGCLLPSGSGFFRNIGASIQRNGGTVGGLTFPIKRCTRARGTIARRDGGYVSHLISDPVHWGRSQFNLLICSLCHLIATNWLIHRFCYIIIVGTVWEVDGLGVLGGDWMSCEWE